MREVLILVALWCGAVTAFAAAGAVVWRLVRPHVETWVQGAARRAIAPLVRDVAAVRDEVVSDPEDATLAERATTAAESSSRVERKVDALHNQVGAVRRRIEQVHGTSLVTRSVLDQHVEESRQYLDRAIEVLEEQGIDMPDTRTPRDPHERK